MSAFYVRVVVGDGGECFAEAWPEEFAGDDFRADNHCMKIEAESCYEAIHAGLARDMATDTRNEIKGFYDDHSLTLRLLGELEPAARKHIHDRRMEERKKMIMKP